MLIALWCRGWKTDGAYTGGAPVTTTADDEVLCPLLVVILFQETQNLQFPQGASQPFRVAKPPWMNINARNNLQSFPCRKKAL